MNVVLRSAFLHADAKEMALHVLKQLHQVAFSAFEWNLIGGPV
jgi:hypothetical protein